MTITFEVDEVEASRLIGIMMFVAAKFVEKNHPESNLTNALADKLLLQLVIQSKKKGYPLKKPAELLN